MVDVLSDSTERDGRTTVAWWGIVAACLSVALLIVSAQPPSRDAAEALSLFATRPRLTAIAATMILGWAVFSIPFVITLGQFLRAPNPGLALSGSILSAIGIALLGFAQFAYIGAMLSIVRSGHAPEAADAIYQATIWANLSFFLTDPGLMIWGLGQLLLGWLARRSNLLPRWLSAIGIISGGAGLLTLMVYQSALLALIQISTFTAWSLATAIVLFRSKPPLRSVA